MRGTENNPPVATALQHLMFFFNLYPLIPVGLVEFTPQFTYKLVFNLPGGKVIFLILIYIYVIILSTILILYNTVLH